MDYLDQILLTSMSPSTSEKGSKIRKRSIKRLLIFGTLAGVLVGTGLAVFDNNSKFKKFTKPVGTGLIGAGIGVGISCTIEEFKLSSIPL